MQRIPLRWQFYIRHDRQINQKCGGFRCSRQPQFYIRNNKNDRQINKNSIGQLRKFTFETIRTISNKSKMRRIPMQRTAAIIHSQQ